MVHKDRTATWLELAVASVRGEAARIGLRAVGDCGGCCVAIVLDDRPLHDGSARMMVFHTPEVAHRFLACCGLETPLPENVLQGASIEARGSAETPRCLDLGRHGRLARCTRQGCAGSG
ncbi:MAG: hypothetical protein LPJ94_10105 [Thauera sp.]|nr:hypothetical protein [Thauera sp.]